MIGETTSRAFTDPSGGSADSFSLAIEWPRERFRAHNIAYEPSTKVKSDIYRDALPILNSGKVRLLDHPKLVSQLCALERRTARGGRDSIDHAPGAHDDVANAVSGVLVGLGASTYDSSFRWVRGDDDVPWGRTQADERMGLLAPGSAVLRGDQDMRNFDDGALILPADPAHRKRPNLLDDQEEIPETISAAILSEHPS